MDDSLVDLQKTLYESKNPTRRWLHRSRRDKIIEIISSSISTTKSRALEVGPGSGVYLPSLCNHFGEVTAIDVEESHLVNLESLLKKFSNLSLVHADLVSKRWDNKFDLVLCSEVIEHVKDTEPFLKGLSEATRSGGILILSTPQPQSVMELTCKIGLSPSMIRLVRLIYGEPVLPTGHINLLSRSELLPLLKKHHFEVLELETFGLYLPLICELMPKLGLDLCKFGEKFLNDKSFKEPLWTQLYIARKL